MGVRFRPRNKKAVVAMEASLVSKAEKSETGAKQNQGDADCVF